MPVSSSYYPGVYSDVTFCSKCGVRNPENASLLMETGRVTNAVVIGLDHDIQENDDGRRLEVIIRVLCEKYQCDLIA